MTFRVLQHLFLIFILATAVACSDSTPQTIRVAHNSWPGYEPLSLAESKALFKDVNVINYRVGSATEVIRSFEQQIVDVAAITLDEAIALQSRIGEQIIIITVLDTSHGGDAIIAKDGITSLSDLKGKRIGLESSALGAFFISRAAELTPDLSLEQLHIVPILYDQHYSSFMEGDIDAIVTFEPVKSNILKTNGHVIFDSSSIENEIVDVLITRQSLTEKYPHELKALVAGYFKALEYIKDHPDESLKSMAEYEHVDVGSFKKSLSGLRIPNRAENYSLLSGHNPALITTIDKVQTFLLKSKIIQTGIDSRRLVTDKFLPR